jgi:sugar phosphate isomerase/epimerase
MHDRVSVNALAFGEEPMEAILEHFRAIGPRRVSFFSHMVRGDVLPKAKAGVQAAGYKVETVTHIFTTAQLTDRAGWEPARALLSETIAGAKAIGARSIYMVTGGRGGLTWEDAAEAFAEAVAPCREEARAAGVDLLVEPAAPLYAEIHVPTNLRDTVLLAEIADLGVCLDVAPSWTEAGLQETIRRAAPRLKLVQVGDYILGDRCVPCRAVVGDGAIPLQRLFGWVLETGFEGAFDLEMLGPRVDAIGAREALRRSAEKTGEILQALGA